MPGAERCSSPAICVARGRGSPRRSSRSSAGASLRISSPARGATPSRTFGERSTGYGPRALNTLRELTRSPHLAKGRDPVNVLMISTMVPDPTGTSAGAIVMHDEIEAVASRHDVTLVTLANAGDEAALRSLDDM